MSSQNFDNIKLLYNSNNPALAYVTMVFIISILFYIYRFFKGKLPKTSSIFFNLYCASIFAIMLHIISYYNLFVAWVLGIIALLFLGFNFISNVLRNEKR